MLIIAESMAIGGASTGKPSKWCLNASWSGAWCVSRCAELVELGLVGQAAEDQEPGGLDEGRALGELLDGDAAVAEDALLAVDEGDLARAGAGVAEAGVERDQAGLGAELGDVDGQLAFGPLDDRQLDRPAIKRQSRGPRHRHGLPSSPARQATSMIHGFSTQGILHPA